MLLFKLQFLLLTLMINLNLSKDFITELTLKSISHVSYFLTYWLTPSCWFRKDQAEWKRETGKQTTTIWVLVVSCSGGCVKATAPCSAVDICRSMRLFCSAALICCCTGALAAFSAGVRPDEVFSICDFSVRTDSDWLQSCWLLSETGGEVNQSQRLSAQVGERQGTNNS